MFCQQQRGVVVIFLTVLLGLMLCALTIAGAKAKWNDSGDRTIKALVAAREALIARAVKGRRDEYNATDEPPFRLGSLPCPDVDNDGDADGANCFNYVGRLPFKTLETEDLRDSTGERLWYVLSPNFRPSVYPTSHASGQLRLTGDVHLQNIVAILIAPGPVTGSQTRDCQDHAGGPNRCAALRVGNYLEGKNAHMLDSVSPSASEAEFETWPASRLRAATFNDTVMAITWDMFMPQVEARVAGEARRCLELFSMAPETRYPWPSTLGKGENTGSRFGWFPMASAFPLTEKICRGSFPYGYFNAWRPLIFYAIAPAVTPDRATSQTRLRVNGMGGVDAVIMLPGRPLEGQSANARLSSPMATREFLESHPHDPSAHNWQASFDAPDDHYAIARPTLTGKRQFNDTVECLSKASPNPCTRSLPP